LALGALLSALFFSAPTIFMASLESHGLTVALSSASVDPRTIIDALPSEVSPTIRYLIDRALPVATLLTAVVNCLLMRKAALVLGFAVRFATKVVPV